MTPCKSAPVLCVLLLPVLLAALAACGGGDNGSKFRTGQLTDPRNVPTASPWTQPPDVIIIDPNALTPIGGGPTPTPNAGGEQTGQPGACGAKYTVASEDTFSSIAEKCNLSTQRIKDANPGVDPLTLHPGDVINLPLAEPTPSPSP